VGNEVPWYEELVLPVLLAEARRTYGSAIRSALVSAGFEDMPRTGARVVGGIARAGSNLTDFARQLGISKQGASQLIDTLVVRGYVERLPDSSDRRRMTVGLTDRGRAAAAEIRGAVEGVDSALADEVGTEEVARTRAVLGALVTIRRDDAI
jgi:DNA-binding MarR family transcriptional regulator